MYAFENLYGHRKRSTNKKTKKKDRKNCVRNKPSIFLSFKKVKQFNYIGNETI